MARQFYRNKGNGSSEKKDPYQEITDLMIQELEKGSIPWRRPWRVSSTPQTNVATGWVYGLSNQIILRTRHFSSPFWLGFKQAKDMGGYVRSGEKSSPVIKWNVVKRTETARTPDEEDREFVFMLPMILRVFNVEQCENIPVPEIPSLSTLQFNPIEEADRIVKNMPNPPQFYAEGGDRAFYRPSTDTIGMPPKNHFSSVPEYYSTLFHEITHSTGHESRLARRSLTETVFFGSEPYAKEELVAEMGASYLCGQSGIIQDTYENSGAYLRSWIQKLKQDKRIFLHSAQLAQRATDYVLNIKRETSE